MALALPVVAIGAATHQAIGETERVAVIIGSILFEAAAIWGAVATYMRYLVRIQKVLGNDQGGSST